MALPWLALIKAVPWTDVVEHAPTVLNAAKKLWNPQSGKALGGGAARPNAPVQRTPEARMADLEEQLADALAQLADTNQLVQDMAEQQARMLVQIDDNRRALNRTRWLAAAALALAVAAVVANWAA